MDGDLLAANESAAGMHGGAEIEKTAAACSQRRRLEGASVFTFAEPMLPTVEIRDERRMREIDHCPRNTGLIEPPKFPTLIEGLFHSQQPGARSGSTGSSTQENPFCRIKTPPCLSLIKSGIL